MNEEKIKQIFAKYEERDRVQGDCELTYVPEYNYVELAKELVEQLAPQVKQKATVIWATYDEYGDLETEFIYKETEENKMPYQCEKYLMENKNKTAKRLVCFSV